MDRQTALGIIRGRTIEIDRDLAFQPGQSVTVSVESTSEAKKLPPGEGVRRSAGAWADDADELDRYLEWNRQQRKIGRGIPE